MVVTFHLEPMKINVEYLKDVVNNKSNKVIIVYLEELIEDQFAAFLGLGGQHNIIPMTRFLESS